MGGPSFYRGVVSGGYPICSFRQFLARMCRFATIQIVTDGRQTDDIGYQRRPYGRPKSVRIKVLVSREVLDYSLVYSTEPSRTQTNERTKSKAGKLKNSAKTVQVSI